MAYKYINIATQGDGSVSFVSSSGEGRQLSSTGLNGTGTYIPEYDYKFLINKKCISISVDYTFTGMTNTSSSISMRNDNGVRIEGIDGIVTASYMPANMYKDRSFTIIHQTIRPGADYTYNINVLFYPKLDIAPILLEKPSSYAKVDTIEPFINSNIDNALIEILASGKEPPTAIDYTNGYMYRYFYRYSSNPASIIRELLKKQYDVISTNSVYKSIRIKWKITGETSSEVESINSNTIENVNIDMIGIKDFLKKRLLEYYRGVTYP